MATIRVREWTKERIDRILEAESHSSHDSVIKTLLRDRELAAVATDGTEQSPAGDRPRPDTAIDGLTVVAEVVAADNGVLFLWCPSCGNEIAYLGIADPSELFAFEAECQRCLTRLDQHAIVGIEVGYPIEERLVTETLADDLQRCVVDYWDRTARGLAEGTLDADVDDDQLLWQFGEYLREFGWDWPADVPVIAIEPGERYHNQASGDYLDVCERIGSRRNGLRAVRARRAGSEDGDGEEIELAPGDVKNLLLSRQLFRTA